MKAKRNFKIKLLICCLMVLLLGTVLVACDDYKPDHYDYLVTFCYNLGTKISGNAPDVYIGVLDPEKDGAYVGIRPGYNNDTFSEASIAGYYLEGWYLPKLDAEGAVVKDADGRVELDREFVFNTDKIYEDTTLYAKLLESPKMKFVDVDTDDVISEIDGKKPGTQRSKPSSSLAPKKEVDGETYTFLGKYYADKECTEEFTFPYIFEDHDVNVYCKFIKGVWTLVETVREFNNAVVNGQNIYLMNDLDFAGQSYTQRNYNAELDGNGKTIRNISISYSLTRYYNNTNIGIFDTLMARAYIHDVTFEGLTIDIKTSTAYTDILGVNVGSLAGRALEGARLQNITISGQITYDENTKAAKDEQRVTIDAFIALNQIKEDQIVNCDHSRVTASTVA